MNPKQIAARFAAYVWYVEQKARGAAVEVEAVHFAGENWRAFLTCAHEGLGRFLIRIAGVGKKTRRRKTGQDRNRSCSVTAAVASLLEAPAAG